MKYKFLAFLAIGILSCQTVMAADISLMINGGIVKPTVSPMQISGTTLVPLRVISENLGATVKWDSKAKKIYIYRDDTTIQLTIGVKKAIVNNKSKTLSLAPIVKNGTTMVPIRFISEELDTPVKWDDETGTVLINTDESYIEGTLTDTQIEYIAEKALGGRVFGSSFTEGWYEYYYFTTIDFPKVSVIVRQDGELFDAYTYNADGILEPLDD